MDDHKPDDKINYLKVRDDRKPTTFEPADEEDRFRLSAGSDASWLGKDQEDFGFTELRQQIEPWLTSLFQSEHFSLLVGSGLTHAVHDIAVGGPAAGMKEIELTHFRDDIAAAAEEAARRSGRGISNLEDQLRVANELLRGLEIMGRGKEADGLRKELESGVEAFARLILKSEADVATADQSKRERAFNALISFLMSFASRTGTRDRLNLFTTNYDRLMESGAELAGLHLLDRFLGNLMPVFRASRLSLDLHYNPPGIRGEPRYLEGVARITKLHGSLDWVQVGDDIRRIGLPFGADEVKPYLKAPGLASVSPLELMIYPNSSKDRETALYPYVDLFRDFAAAVCRPNSTLVTYGYSFGDDHINRMIRDMLTIPSSHLVVISQDDKLRRILPLANERKSQVSLLVGPNLADLNNLTEYFLPKAAIDRATFRMTELLNRRYGPGDSRDGKDKKVEQPNSEAAP